MGGQITIRIGKFHRVAPRFRLSQSDTLDWLAGAHVRVSDGKRSSEEMRRLIERYGCSPKQLAFRGLELADFCHSDFEEMQLFHPKFGPEGAPMETRMAFFQTGAERVFSEWYPDANTAVTDLIHVSCTGYLAPSAPQIRMSAIGRGAHCQILHAYHMGCYAAIPALRMARGLVAESAERQVDIAHTEMCALHFNPHTKEPEQLVVQTLFADGFMKYSLVDQKQSGFDILAIREEMLPQTQQLMQWSPKAWGMGMVLSRKVPEAIKTALPKFLERLFQEAGLSFEEEFSRLQFAVHPGGPKILDGIREQLQLSRQQLAISGKILYDHGNMSSATLPHIWEAMLSEKEIPADTKVVSLAFGPGLTIAGALMEKQVD